MGLKHVLLLVVLVTATALGIASDASAGSIADFTPCPRGGAYLVCPVGTTGQSYSIKFRGDEEPICSPGDDKWYARSGTVPPGLTLATDGTLSGTPTTPGTYTFWLHLELPDYFNPEPPPGSGCSSRDNSEEQISVTIVAGLAKLTIGPESTAPGTTGAPYSLQMTASVGEAKTWSIASGSLPPGLGIDTNTGLISGTPTTAGTYSFEVLAQMNGDTRTDSKALGIVVRSPLRIATPAGFLSSGGARAEVGVPLSTEFAASGGSATYQWSTTGDLPPGVTFDDGALAGAPESSGRYQFVITVTDTEARVANLNVTIAVADELEISTLLLRPGKVGRFYRAKIATTGGVVPKTLRILRGPLPRGVRFDRLTGVLSGFPTKPGRYRVTFEARDAFKVTDLKTFRITIAAAPKPKKS